MLTRSSPTILINDIFYRSIFCTFWLYFYAFRELLGNQRILDYAVIIIVFVSFISLIIEHSGSTRLFFVLAPLIVPLCIGFILSSHADDILFICKTCFLLTYFALYIRVVKLSIIEYISFSLPLLITLFFLFNPRASNHSLERLSGIDEPNFTSLSLIYCLSASFSIYLFTSSFKMKLISIFASFLSIICILLTQSRAGLVSSLIAIVIFLLIKIGFRFTFICIMLLSTFLIILPDIYVTHNIPLFQRFHSDNNELDLGALTNNRDVLAEKAIDDIINGAWFISGSPQRVHDWGQYSSFNVPHNSFLDIGIAFGKAPFYIYIAYFVGLLALNIRIVVLFRVRRVTSPHYIIGALFFLSLTPMYLSLSAGMAMSFLIWLSFGAYPFLMITDPIISRSHTHITRRIYKPQVSSAINNY